MVNTFDALAKFGTDDNANADTQPDNDNTASVDLSAVITRLNDLENAINELRREKMASEPQTTSNNSGRLENEPNTDNNNGQGDNDNGN